MNRAMRRAAARRIVKRGGVSGHMVREARRKFAAAVTVEATREPTPEERAAELGLEVPKKRLWVPGWMRRKS